MMDQLRALGLPGVTSAAMLNAIRSYHDHILLGTDYHAQEADISAYAITEGISKDEARARVIEAHDKLYDPQADAEPVYRSEARDRHGVILDFDGPVL